MLHWVILSSQIPCGRGGHSVLRLTATVNVMVIPSSKKPWLTSVSLRRKGCRPWTWTLVRFCSVMTTCDRDTDRELIATDWLLWRDQRFPTTIDHLYLINNVTFFTRSSGKTQADSTCTKVHIVDCLVSSQSRVFKLSIRMSDVQDLGHNCYPV